MEAFQQSHESILAIPSTRRYRLIMKKVDLEAKREAALKQAQSKASHR